MCGRKLLLLCLLAGLGSKTVQSRQKLNYLDKMASHMNAMGTAMEREMKEMARQNEQLKKSFPHFKFANFTSAMKDAVDLENKRVFHIKPEKNVMMSFEFPSRKRKGRRRSAQQLRAATQSFKQLSEAPRL